MATVIQPYMDPSVGNKENAPPADLEAMRAKIKQLASRSAPQPQATPNVQVPSRQPLAPRTEASLTHAQSQQNATRGAVAAHEAPRSSQSLDDPLLWSIDEHPLSPKELEARDKLVQAVRMNTKDPQAWLELLTFDNTILSPKRHTSGQVSPHSKVVPLYQAATAALKDTPKNDPILGRIWTDYAVVLIKVSGAMDARKTFVWMANNGIGQQEKNFYLHYASIESNNDKLKNAMAILQQGIARNVPDKAVLEEKLKVYTSREATKLAAASSAASSAALSAVPVAGAPAPVSAAPASVAPTVAPPATPSVNVQQVQDPFTPSTAAPIASVNTPASRRRLVRGLGLPTGKLGGAARVPAAEATAALDADDDDVPSTPAEPERPLERSASLPARPTPAPPLGTAPHPPAPMTGHTTCSERTANSTLAAPSPMSHRSTHHIGTTTGASGFLSTVNNSTLSTSSSSSSSSSGSSPTRTRTRHSVASFPSTPQAPTTSNNSVALITDSAANTPHAPPVKPVTVQAPAPSMSAAPPAAMVAPAAPGPAPPAASSAVPSSLPPSVSQPAAALIAAPAVPKPVTQAPTAVAHVAAPVAPAPALAARASVAASAPILPSSNQAPAPTAAPAGASAAPVVAPKPAGSLESWAKEEKEQEARKLEKANEAMFMVIAKSVNQQRAESNSTLPGVVFVEGRGFLPWEVIGRGGYSTVYKALGSDMKFYALKRIEPKSCDEEFVKSATENEVSLLQQLKGEPHIIQLEAFHIPENGRQISLVFELGDTDLESVIKTVASKPLPPAPQENEITPRKPMVPENFIRFYWTQMLEAVQAIHEHEIIHSDLKPSNFVCVKGQLKLIDFGISGKIESNQTSMVRTNFVGTVCYMAPETLVGVSVHNRVSQKVGRPSDVWSLGCILYQMVYGKPPYMDKKQQERVQLITTGKRIPMPPLTNPALWQIINQCLTHNAKARPKISEILRCEFLCPKEQGGGN